MTPDLTRRAAVAGVGAIAALGGCTGLLSNSPDHEQARDPWGDEQREPTATGETVTVPITLKTGQWAVWQLQPQLATRLSYDLDVQTNNPAEVIVFNRTEFDRFREGDDITQLVGLHGTGTNPSASGRLIAGEYRLAVVNSDYGEVSPSGEVRGDLTITSEL